MMHGNLRLAIYQPLGTGNSRVDLDINPEVVGLKYSTSTPGGFNGLDVGFTRQWLDPTRMEYRAVGYLEDRADIPEFAHVRLFDGGVLLWEGRVNRLRKPGGEIRGFTAVGYGLWATNDGYYSSSDASATSAGAVVRAALAALPTPIGVGGDGQFQDTGTAHTKAEFDLMTPAQVLDQLSKEGGASHEWDWWVWERVLWWLPRRAPDVATYHIPFDVSVEWDEDYTDVFPSAAVNYTIAGVDTTTADATNADTLGRYGVQRTALLAGGEMTTAGAGQFRTTQLARMAYPEISATVTRDHFRGMEMLGGGERPAHLVRAGEWVAVGDQPPQIIVSAQCDGNTGEVQLDLANPSRVRGDVLTRDLREVRRALREKVDIRSGGRVRG